MVELHITLVPGLDDDLSCLSAFKVDEGNPLGLESLPILDDQAAEHKVLVQLDPLDWDFLVCFGLCPLLLLPIPLQQLVSVGQIVLEELVDLVYQLDLGTGWVQVPDEYRGLRIELGLVLEDPHLQHVRVHPYRLLRDELPGHRDQVFPSFEQDLEAEGRVWAKPDRFLRGEQDELIEG